MKSTIVSVYVVAKGDFVHCKNCGSIMLLPCGANKCPRCSESGYLAWKEGDDIIRLREQNKEQVQELGYQVQECSDLQVNDYFENRQ